MKVHPRVARYFLLYLFLTTTHNSRDNGDFIQRGLALAFTSTSTLPLSSPPRSSSLCRKVSSESWNCLAGADTSDAIVSNRDNDIFQKQRLITLTALTMVANSGGDGVIDAVIEEEEANSTLAKEEISAGGELDVIDPTRRRKRDMVRDVVKSLASLSLEDYRWRSNIFKKNEADRKVEESIARMMGEDASYVRPMDASENKLGPLGKAEKDAVAWLSSVIEEEGKRAARIANSDGDLVRPMDGEGGPLADLERNAVEFFNKIVDSEKARANTGTLRPKDLDASMRGPLGEAEATLVAALKQISESEKIRAAQTKVRGGEVVRPIDVPGPLGEAERVVLEFVLAERQRARDRESNGGKVVRPMASSETSPMGKAERRAVEALGRLKEEERERLQNLLRLLADRRPMEADRDSPLGVTERIAVSVLRGPMLLGKVVDRVKELLQSEKLDEDDEKILRLAASKSTEEEDNSNDSKEETSNK
uniref:Uncharacterized protein n=2 Tax=Ditylum brightwellii TaxID=49249 RepID=A0A7S4RUM5_9STRA|mmetsp:Transcript_33507/g.50534  ORF Transcript_33507/g.50534 Transcript_33507/m.50534 type:complete len:479 (+) Transcript_33507:215-1651(+)